MNLKNRRVYFNMYHFTFRIFFIINEPRGYFSVAFRSSKIEMRNIRQSKWMHKMCVTSYNLINI